MASDIIVLTSLISSFCPKLDPRHILEAASVWTTLVKIVKITMCEFQVRSGIYEIPVGSHFLIAFHSSSKFSLTNKSPSTTQQTRNKIGKL